MSGVLTSIQEYTCIRDTIPTIPQLLVSVRNPEEAVAAIAGGCQIVDVKEPTRGPLGMADTDVISAIATACAEVPLSVALGEASAWPATATAPTLPAGIAWLKLGTAGLGSGTTFRRRIDETFVPLARSVSVRGTAPTCGWILVAYADHQTAHGPSPVETLDAAIELGCAGLLVDTFTKTGAGLFGCCDPAFLRALARRANDANLLFALAGRLTLADAPHLAAVGGDVVGIRSAACRGSERTGPVDPDAIRDFRAALEAAAGARLTSRT